MPHELAAALAAFGHEFDGAIAQQTAALYAPQPRVYEQAEIAVTKDLAYGPHERQRVDIYTRARRPAEPVPAIVVFHGGGLIGGSRGATTNVAEYFASLGYVGVNGGYRLAPDAKWPDGARDVAAAVGYLRDHVAEHGGDPERIFVAGISTGALHAATYVFRPELLPADAARAAGAILVSGPYTFDFAAAGRGELAYFGEDRARWPEMVVTGNVTRADIPVLMTTAEWDNARYTKALRGALPRARHEARRHAALFAELGPQPFVAAVVGRHGGPERLEHHRRLHRAHGRPLAARARCTIRAWACSSVG